LAKFFFGSLTFQNVPVYLQEKILLKEFNFSLTSKKELKSGFPDYSSV